MHAHLGLDHDRHAFVGHLVVKLADLVRVVERVPCCATPRNGKRRVNEAIGKTRLEHCAAGRRPRALAPNKRATLSTRLPASSAMHSTTYDSPLHPRVCTPTRTATASGLPLISSLMRSAARSVIVMGSRSWSLLRAGLIASGASPMMTLPAAFASRGSVHRIRPSWLTTRMDAWCETGGGGGGGGEGHIHDPTRSGVIEQEACGTKEGFETSKAEFGDSLGDDVTTAACLLCARARTQGPNIVLFGYLRYSSTLPWYYYLGIY
jgi:hypothetical protein